MTIDPEVIKQVDRLVEAIKHPIVQVRPLVGLALKAVEAHRDITTRLRTVFGKP